MNGAKMQVANLNGLSNKALNKMVQHVLTRFCETGELILPPEFNARKNKSREQLADHKGSLYLHDRDEKANRNLWDESSSLKDHRK